LRIGSFRRFCGCGHPATGRCYPGRWTSSSCAGIPSPSSHQEDVLVINPQPLRGLTGSRPAGQVEPGDGRRIVRRPAGAAAGYWARPSPGRCRQPAAGGGGAGLAGGVALEAADDLRLGFSFAGAAFGVGAGGRVGTQAGEHDPPQRMVGLAVAAGVEPVADGFCPTMPGSGRHRTGAPRRPKSAAAGGDLPRRVA
jgi:hypothetical protein